MSIPSISKLHAAAREFAKAGIPIFPCLPRRKTPATEKGFHDASCDLAQIDAWWTENPEYNIAYSPHEAGLAVIDLDGEAGIAAWEAIEAERPATYTVRTPRGGLHKIYAGEISTSAWAPGRKRCLGEHIDTRGKGSYVLAPPSYVCIPEENIDGYYKVIDARAPSDIPSWMPARVAKTDDRAKSSVATLDLPAAVNRGRSLLNTLVSRGDVAVAGRGGNNRTYELSCELLDLGVAPDTARELLTEIWNPHCIPPWQSDELATIVTNASNHQQNEAGAWAAQPASETFADVLDKLPATVPEPVRRSRFYAENESEQENAPDPTWVVPQIIPDMATVLIIGAKGSFKSFLAQDLLMSIASGAETFGVRPERTGPVFYGAHEGRNQIKKPRRNAWRLAHDMHHELPFYVMAAPQVSSEEQCEEFREQIRVRLRQGPTKIAGIVLDTVAKCMIGLNENDARDCGIFSNFCDRLRDEFECPIIALHHFGKDEGRGGRGSSALPANFDTVISLSRHEKSLLLLAQVNYHKDAPEPEHPFAFEGRPVAQSLVFQPLPLNEYRMMTAKDDPFDGRKIGAALRKLKAIGRDCAVSRRVLSAELFPPRESESVEERERILDRASLMLGKLARSKLEAYCEQDGREALWFLPAD